MKTAFAYSGAGARAFMARASVERSRQASRTKTIGFTAELNDLSGTATHLRPATLCRRALPKGHHMQARANIPMQRLSQEHIGPEPANEQVFRNSFDRTDRPALSIDPARQSSSEYQPPLPCPLSAAHHSLDPRMIESSPEDVSIPMTGSLPDDAAIELADLRSAASLETLGVDVVNGLTSFLDIKDALALALTNKATQDIVMQLPRIRIVAEKGRDLQQTQREVDRLVQQLKWARACTAGASVGSGIASSAIMGTFFGTGDYVYIGPACGIYALSGGLFLAQWCIADVIDRKRDAGNARVENARLELQAAVASFNQGASGPRRAQDSIDDDLAEPEVRIAVQNAP